MRKYTEDEIKRCTEYLQRAKECGLLGEVYSTAMELAGLKEYEDDPERALKDACREWDV